MSKKISLTNHSVEDLHTLVRGKRDELQGLRFSVAGSKNRNVKQARTLRKEVARALTQLSAIRSTSLDDARDKQHGK